MVCLPPLVFSCVSTQTLLSLSKLSLLAAKGGRADTSQLDSALYRIEYQQNLPQETLEVKNFNITVCTKFNVQLCPSGSWFGRWVDAPTVHSADYRGTIYYHVTVMCLSCDLCIALCGRGPPSAWWWRGKIHRCLRTHPPNLPCECSSRVCVCAW